MGKRFFLHENGIFPSAGQEEYVRSGEGLVYHFGEAYRGAGHARP